MSEEFCKQIHPISFFAYRKIYNKNENVQYSAKKKKKSNKSPPVKKKKMRKCINSYPVFVVKVLSPSCGKSFFSS